MRNISSCSSYLAKLLLEYVDDRYLIRYVREFLAETLGTFALVLFGDGAVAQVKRPNVLLIFCFYVLYKPNNAPRSFLARRQGTTISSEVSSTYVWDMASP